MIRRLLPLLALVAPGPALADWIPAEAERTIAFGFAAIVERHLHPVSAATLAVDGMRGLADIDPQFAVSVRDGGVRLSTAEATVGEFGSPADNDAAGWAKVTAAVIEAARLQSARLRDADAEKLYQAVFEGALGKADLHSRYAGAWEAREHRASRNGFGGIGIRFDLVDSEPRIVEVIEDTPAARAGLRVGDVIITIDGQPVATLDRVDISSRLRGAVSTELSLTVRRDGQPLDIGLRRSRIVPRTVTMTLSDGIARLRVSSFNRLTAHSLEEQVKIARDRLGPGLLGVVLDLRGNPGGLLDKAVAVADLFIAQGPIVSTKGRHPESVHAFAAHPGDIAEDLPVVVLVDGRSASAAEIVASALQDAGRAVVVGTNSYGKGTVQTVIDLPNGGEITLTWSRFHAPSGYALHGLGVLPTLCTGQGATPTAILDGLARGKWSPTLPETLAVWRSAGLGETDLRLRLRGGCPPARRADARADMDLAERLLLNGAAHARALSMSTPPRMLEARRPGIAGPEQPPH
ncbi:S41 family peptidase [Magnetospirillum sp. SS-4]|uniref:S41 family peptidase n=1 Tax=Magnetospirillum sp. SS-4 TaxID=2681465 RepID=UPI0015739E4C|nr:S41 family peptidase [Magnetospirillum sp. SS-4]